MSEEISCILQLLPKKGYPDVQEVTCCIKVPLFGGLFGYRYKYHVKAGWLLHTYDHATDGRTGEYFWKGYFLLSDGRILHGYKHALTLYEYASSELLSYLKELRKKLEAMSNK